MTCVLASLPHIWRRGEKADYSVMATLTQFAQEEEDWTTYVERLEHYFAANDVVDDGKKRSILLAVCGSSTYKLVRNLISADRLATTSFKDLVEKVREFYAPKPSVIVQRFKFNSRVRTKEESIAVYLAALRELSEFCEYGETLNEMLRDRLVCGVNHEGLQRKLLAEKELTYEKAVELALATETAEKGSQDLKNSSASGGQQHSFHLAQHAGRLREGNDGGARARQDPIVCYRCGKDHLASVCRHKETVCRKVTWRKYAGLSVDKEINHSTGLGTKERRRTKTLITWIKTSLLMKSSTRCSGCQTKVRHPTCLMSSSMTYL